MWYSCFPLSTAFVVVSDNNLIPEEPCLIVILRDIKLCSILFTHKHICKYINFMVK